MRSWFRLRTLTAAARLIAVIALLAAAAALGAPQAARAANPTPTSVTISAQPTATIGDEVTVRATLTSNGVGLPSRLLELLVDGRSLRTASVDGQGVALIPIRAGELITAGQTTVTVRFRGTPSLGASSGSAVIAVRPARLTIRTIPAVDGIAITVGSTRVTTANGGVATFAIPKLGSWAVSPNFMGFSMPAMRADFVRWGDNVYTSDRHVTISGNTDLELGVHTAFRGSFRFVNGAGAVIDPSRIQSVTLTSTSGSEVVLTQYSGVWLEAGTAVKRLDALAESPRTWRVLDVEMDGTNVVNRGQQRLEPSPDATWTVGLLLYDLHVEAHDALLGAAISGTLELVYPDNSTRVVKLAGPNDSADFLQLPRGNYTLRLSGAGLGAPTPVVLSQGQTAVIRVITYFDLGLFGVLILGTIAGLLWLGRREQLVTVAQRFRLVLRDTAGETRGRARGARLMTSRTADGLTSRLASVAHAAQPWLQGRWGFVRSGASDAGAAVAHDARQVSRSLGRSIRRGGSYGLDRSFAGQRGIAIAVRPVEPAAQGPDTAPSAAGPIGSPAGATIVSDEPSAVPHAAADVATVQPAVEPLSSEPSPAAKVTSRAAAAKPRASRAKTRTAPEAEPATSKVARAKASSSTAKPKTAPAKSRASSASGSDKGSKPRVRKEIAAGASPKSRASSKTPRKAPASASSGRSSPRSSSTNGNAAAPRRAAASGRTATNRKQNGTSTKASPRSVTGLSGITPIPTVTHLSMASRASAERVPAADAHGTPAPSAWVVELPSPPAQTGLAPGSPEAPSADRPRWAEIMARTFERAPGAEVEYKRSVPPVQADTGTCPHCGRSVASTAMYCRSCGGLVRTPGRPGNGA